MDGWYLTGILGLALLMVVHEGGHFLAARAFGMRVTKFSIGFGPTFFKIVPKDGYFWFTTAADKVRLRLWKHDPEKHGPTIYQVAMIPFLAYVQIAGMNPLEDIEPNDKGSYANASLWARIVTIFGGPLSNYLFASVFFFLAYIIGGKLIVADAYVAPLPERPAAAAGMLKGDKVVEVGGTPVHNWDEMAAQISKRPGEPTKVVVERKVEDKSERITLDIIPANENGKGKIGVAPGKYEKVDVPVREAALLAVTEPPKVVKSLVVGLGQMITGKVEGELGGPKRIMDEMASAAKRSLPDWLSLLGAISAYLGAFNLIPFPALDGGRLMFLGYEAATRRRPNARIEAWIHFAGIVMLLGLMFYVTIFKDFGLGAK